jgi:hypothetical protein
MPKEKKTQTDEESGIIWYFYNLYYGDGNKEAGRDGRYM